MSNDLKVGTGNKSTIRYKTQRNQLASQKAGKEMSIARVYANNTYASPTWQISLRCAGV